MSLRHQSRYEWTPKKAGLLYVPGRYLLFGQDLNSCWYHFVFAVPKMGHHKKIHDFLVVYFVVQL